MKKLTSVGRKQSSATTGPWLQRSNSNSSAVSVGELRRRASVESMSTTGANSYDTDNAKNLQYVETLMYGRYSVDLAEFAYKEGKKLRDGKEKVDDLFSKELHPYKGEASRFIVSFVRPVWNNTFARIGEDWVFLFVLGILMATVSFGLDLVTGLLFKARMYFHILLDNEHWTLSAFVWVLLPTLLVMFAVSFTQWMAPSAAGSGIPEMKTILRGVVLKEYLTWRTFVAKIVGLTAVLGSGLPLGKEGPVMHMASIVATLLTKMLRIIKGAVENEQRTTDLLAAACTMGVSVCYAAPIGGVLFSIEVTTTYFAVRNYWRGFFAAVVGALFYRLMGVWFMGPAGLGDPPATISPLFKVSYHYIYPYDVIELFPFVCVSIIGGFMGAGFVFCHRRYVMFMRHNRFIKKFLMKHRMLYPICVALLVSTTTYPSALGQFMAYNQTTPQQVLHMFSNVTWGQYGDPEPARTEEQFNILKHYTNDNNQNFHLSLLIFEIATLIHICVSSTLPVASGMLIPLMKVGGAFGRMVGELMAATYPNGIVPGFPVVPGAYAMVGAASFCASITHTISISVVVFELTGQITYIIPIMIGVLISNCIAALLQPSIYDSVIRIKKLPYLPDIVATTSSDVYNTFVEDIMVKELTYIWYSMTYNELKQLLKENRRIKFFPLVDGHEHMILLGSVKRIELVRLLLQQIAPDKRRKEAQRRQIEALKKKWLDEDASNPRQQSRIRYEDEVQGDDDDDDDVGDLKAGSGTLLQKMGRTFTRSLARSRSMSRARSQTNLEALVKNVVGDQTATLTLPIDNSATIHSSSSTAKLGNSSPPSAHHTDVRDIFGQREALQRGSLKLPLTATTADAPNGSSKAPSAAAQKAPAKPADGDKNHPTVTSPLKKIQNKFHKEKKAAKKKEMDDDEERRVFRAARRASTIKRSNSLDSLKVRGSEDLGVATSRPASPEAPQLLALDDSSVVTPVKGILKRRNSFSLGSLSTALDSPTNENQSQTITVADTKLRSAFEKMRRLKMDTAVSMELKLSQISLFRPKKKEYPVKRHMVDLVDEEREEWENSQLSLEVNFDLTTIDPAPFQLVERTSLLRVHSLFSLLGINHAYVTNIGRLRGVVALKELRIAIEGSQEKDKQKHRNKPKPVANDKVPEVVHSGMTGSIVSATLGAGMPSRPTGQVSIAINDQLNNDPELGLTTTRRVNHMQHNNNERMT